jgi:hypothetical protein
MNIYKKPQLEMDYYNNKHQLKIKKNGTSNKLKQQPRAKKIT